MLESLKGIATRGEEAAVRLLRQFLDDHRFSLSHHAALALYQLGKLSNISQTETNLAPTLKQAVTYMVLFEGDAYEIAANLPQKLLATNFQAASLLVLIDVTNEISAEYCSVSQSGDRSPAREGYATVKLIDKKGTLVEQKKFPGGIIGYQTGSKQFLNLIDNKIHILSPQAFIPDAVRNAIARWLEQRAIDR